MTHDSDCATNNGPATDTLSARLAEWGALAKVIDEILSYDVLSGRTGDTLKAAHEAIPALIAMVRERDAEIAVLRSEINCAEEEMSELREETGWTDIEGRLMTAEARATGAEERVKETQAALTEVMEWIDNWSPRFVDDDEWSGTRDRALEALGRQA